MRKSKTRRGTNAIGVYGAPTTGDYYLAKNSEGPRKGGEERVRDGSSDYTRRTNGARRAERLRGREKGKRTCEGKVCPNLLEKNIKGKETDGARPTGEVIWSFTLLKVTSLGGNTQVTLAHGKKIS